ncbi:MAG: hypothetical protein R3300_07840 [Candidatus Promineifilaceae bacterium]|nr:hypothetical protein [Candidatus Promineifilaceae bacterium]
MRRFAWLPLLLLLLGTACAVSVGGRVGNSPPRTPAAQPETVLLFSSDYPARGAPYQIQSGAFWLVHTPDGRIFAFDPLSPTEQPKSAVRPCRYVWSKPVARFVDPCSGDEWTLDGRLNIAHSTELWSHRDLDRYATNLQGDAIQVHLDQPITGTVRVKTSSP